MDIENNGARVFESLYVLLLTLAGESKRKKAIQKSIIYGIKHFFRQREKKLTFQQSRNNWLWLFPANLRPAIDTKEIFRDFFRYIYPRGYEEAERSTPVNEFHLIRRVTGREGGDEIFRPLCRDVYERNVAIDKMRVGIKKNEKTKKRARHAKVKRASAASRKWNEEPWIAPGIGDWTLTGLSGGLMGLSAFLAEIVWPNEAPDEKMAHEVFSLYLPLSLSLSCSFAPRIRRLNHRAAVGGSAEYSLWKYNGGRVTFSRVRA